MTSNLAPGERILWQGQPSRRLLLCARDAFLVPFSLFFCAFAIFWELLVARRNAPIIFSLWGIPFVLVGLYLVAGRFLVDAWVRSKTRYTLTNRRILIDRSGLFAKSTSLDLNSLPQINVTTRHNGLGTLRFGPPITSLPTNGAAIWSPIFDPTPQLLYINNPQNVLDLIRSAKRRL